MVPTRPDSPDHHSSDGEAEDFTPLPRMLDNLGLDDDTTTRSRSPGHHSDIDHNNEDIQLPDTPDNLEPDDDPIRHPDSLPDDDDGDDPYIPLPHMLNFFDPACDSEKDVREGIRAWARCTRDVLALNGLLGQDVEIAIYSDSDSDEEDDHHGRRGDSDYSAFSSPRRFSDSGDDEGAAGAAVGSSRTSDEGFASNDANSAHRGRSTPLSPSSVHVDEDSALASANPASSAAHSLVHHNSSSSGVLDLSPTISNDITFGSPHWLAAATPPRRNAVSDATPRDFDPDIASNTALPDDWEAPNEQAAARVYATSDDRQNRFLGPATEGKGKKKRKSRRSKAKKHGKSKKLSLGLRMPNTTGASSYVPWDDALPTNGKTSGDCQTDSATPATNDSKGKKKRKGKKSKSKKRPSLKHDPREPNQNVRAARLEKEKHEKSQRVSAPDGIPLSEDREPRPTKQKAKAERKAIMAAQLTRELCEIIIGYQQQLLGFAGRQVQGCDGVTCPLHQHVGDDLASSPRSPKSDGGERDEQGTKSPGSPPGGAGPADTTIESSGPSSTVLKAAPADDHAADLKSPQPAVILDGRGCKPSHRRQQDTCPMDHGIGVLDDWTEPSESAAPSCPPRHPTCAGTHLTERPMLPDLLSPGSLLSTLAALLNLKDSPAHKPPSSSCSTDSSTASLPPWVRDPSAPLPSLPSPVACFPVHNLHHRYITKEDPARSNRTSRKPPPLYTAYENLQAERARNAQRERVEGAQRREAFRELQNATDARRVREWREEMGDLLRIYPRVLSYEVGLPDAEWEEEVEFQRVLQDGGASTPAAGVVAARPAGHRRGRRGQRRGGR